MLEGDGSPVVDVIAFELDTVIEADANEDVEAYEPVVALAETVALDTRAEENLELLVTTAVEVGIEDDVTLTDEVVDEEVELLTGLDEVVDEEDELVAWFDDVVGGAGLSPYGA